MKSPRTRNVKGNSKRGTPSSLGKLLIYAPIVLEVLSLLRRSQKAKQGKDIKARKRDRALDFLLGQAQRRMVGGRGRRR